MLVAFNQLGLKVGERAIYTSGIVSFSNRNGNSVKYVFWSGSKWVRFGMGGVMDQLPSFCELVDRFSLFNSSQASPCNTQIGVNGSLFCNCKGCIQWQDYVEGRDPRAGAVKYEVFTTEYVTELAHYLRARSVDYELSTMDVLEVGAGSGQLTCHLNQALSRIFAENQGPVVTVTATDNGDRGLNGPLVEKEDACYAISTRKAHIIISSWMPRGVDWTGYMRAASSVLEYVLIGETDYGICGCPWETWGWSQAFDSSESDISDTDDLYCSSSKVDLYPSRLLSLSKGKTVTKLVEDIRASKRQCVDGLAKEPQGNVSNIGQLKTSVVSCFVGDREDCSERMLVDAVIEGVSRRKETNYIKSNLRVRPLYEIDGWERVELENLSKIQLCRTDERWSTTRHSHTVAFRRNVRHSTAIDHTSHSVK